MTLNHFKIGKQISTQGNRPSMTLPAILLPCVRHSDHSEHRNSLSLPGLVVVLAGPLISPSLNIWSHRVDTPQKILFNYSSFCGWSESFT